MIKVRVHVLNDYDCTDDNVFIDITLPAVPRIGEFLYLTPDQKRHLETMLKSKPEIIMHYDKWFYMKSHNAKSLSEVDLNDVFFDDIMTVESVSYFASEDFVRIELTD